MIDVDDGRNAGPEAELVVSEVFGPTLQGEGPSLGRRAAFVRLGRCNLACSWCDTPYTWDWDRFDPAVELVRRPVGAVVAEVLAMQTPLLVVTGGEPLLQQRALTALAVAAAAAGLDVEVETSGTVPASPALAAAVGRFNVSPKLASTGMALARRLRPEVLRALAEGRRSVFKFVVAEAGELDEVAAVAEATGIAASTVWIMAEGTEADVVVARTRALAGPVIERGWNLTTRLHVLVWGDRRGV